MDQYYHFSLCGLERDIKIVPVSAKTALASFVIIGDTELVTTVAPTLLAHMEPVDYLVTAEAKGICLAYELSRQMGHKEIIVARKSAKPYMQNVVSASVNSITTQKKQTLYLNGMDADKVRGKRVTIVDDVIATGESLNAVEELLKAAGAIVVQKVAVLAELDSVEREDILFLKEHPVYNILPDGSYEMVRPIGTHGICGKD